MIHDLTSAEDVILTDDPVQTARLFVRLRGKTSNLDPERITGHAGKDPLDGVHKSATLTISMLTALADEIERLRAQVARHEDEIVDAYERGRVAGLEQ